MSRATLVLGPIVGCSIWRLVYLLISTWLVMSLPGSILWFCLSDLGGYPLNDDPFYAKPIEWWATEGRYQVALQSGELTASSLAHVAVGACAIVGHDFHYRWLYVACIAQQSLGAAALYGMARCLGHKVFQAAIFAGCLLSFPLYFGHAFTFMTDGPAAAWSALAMTSLVWGTLRASPRWLCIGSLAIGWSYWIRQTNAALLAIPMMALLMIYGLHRHSHNQRHDQRHDQRDDHRDDHARSSRSELRQLGWLTLACVGLAGGSIGLFESGSWLPSSLSRVSAIQPEADTNYGHRVAVAIYGWGLLVGWFSLPCCPMLIHSAYHLRKTMSLGPVDSATSLALCLSF